MGFLQKGMAPPFGAPSHLSSPTIILKEINRVSQGQVGTGAWSQTQLNL